MKALHGNGIADLHRRARPTLTHEQIRARELHAPIGYVTAVVLDVDVESSVRIPPFDLRYGANQLDRLLRIELGGK